MVRVLIGLLGEWGRDFGGDMCLFIRDFCIIDDDFVVWC
jgi:hypothetical protein